MTCRTKEIVVIESSPELQELHTCFVCKKLVNLVSTHVEPTCMHPLHVECYKQLCQEFALRHETVVTCQVCGGFVVELEIEEPACEEVVVVETPRERSPDFWTIDSESAITKALIHHSTLEEMRTKHAIAQTFNDLIGQKLQPGHLRLERKIGDDMKRVATVSQLLAYPGATLDAIETHLGLNVRDLLTLGATKAELEAHIGGSLTPGGQLDPQDSFAEFIHKKAIATAAGASFAPLRDVDEAEFPSTEWHHEYESDEEPETIVFVPHAENRAPSRPSVEARHHPRDSRGRYTGAPSPGISSASVEDSIRDRIAQEAAKLKQQTGDTNVYAQMFAGQSLGKSYSGLYNKK